MNTLYASAEKLSDHSTEFSYTAGAYAVPDVLLVAAGNRLGNEAGESQDFQVVIDSRCP